MNEQCPIVQDLLPIYLEELCSEESRRFIDSHLAECASCAKEYHDMKGQIARLTPHDIEEGAVLQSMHKTYRSIRVRTLMIAVVIAILVFIGLAGAYSYVLWHYVGMSGTEVDLFSLAQAPNGAIYYGIDSSRYNYRHSATKPMVAAEENALYINQYRSVLRTPLSEEDAARKASRIDVINNPLEASRIGAWAENGRMYIMQEGLSVEIKKIYVGKKDNYRLVWQEGDEIPMMPYAPELTLGANHDII